MLKKIDYTITLNSVPAPVIEKPEVKLEARTFEELRNFIYERSGIYLTDNQKQTVENRLKKRVEALQLGSFSEYLTVLKSEDGGEDESIQLMDAITINETHFFRNQAQVNALVDVVLPEIFEEKSGQKKKILRILSAGCASGEEPYSLAILLHHYFSGKLQDYSIEIIGTDISRQVLETASRAIYSEFSLQKLEKDIVETHFQKRGGRYQLAGPARKLVAFKYVNLMSPEAMLELGQFDLIFCRNVIIYFDDVARQRTAEILFKLINPGGYLFLGQSESFYGLNHSFDLTHFKKSIAYKKSPGQ